MNIVFFAYRTTYDRLEGILPLHVWVKRFSKDAE